jgi:hypothetical protein
MEDERDIVFNKVRPVEEPIVDELFNPNQTA